MIRLIVPGNRVRKLQPEPGSLLESDESPDATPVVVIGERGDAAERSIRVGLNAVFMILLAVICGNVGALVFARIATRERELTVRNALGASRRRLISQLFVEALALTSIGAVVVLAALRWGLQRAEAYFWSAERVTPPFWRDIELNATTVLYVAVLTVLAAFVTGVLPGARERLVGALV